MIDDMPVGYAILHWRQTGQNARLYSLAVLERWRQQGIARRLIDNITGLAQEKGKTGLSLEVRAHQPELIGFYTKLGFSAVRDYVNNL